MDTDNTMENYYKALCSAQKEELRNLKVSKMASTVREEYLREVIKELQEEKIRLMLIGKNTNMNERGFTVQDYKDSISADDTDEMFTLAYQWQDKKHRHIWDLCNWIEQLQAELEKEKKAHLDLCVEHEELKEKLIKLQAIVDAARQTLRDNLHLTDGDDCTLYELREAFRFEKGEEE